MNKVAFRLTVAAVVLLLLASGVVLELLERAQRSYVSSHVHTNLTSVVSLADLVTEDARQRLRAITAAPQFAALALPALRDDRADGDNTELQAWLLHVTDLPGVAGFLFETAEHRVIAHIDPARIGRFDANGASLRTMRRADGGDVVLSPILQTLFPLNYRGHVLPPGTRFQLACSALREGGATLGYFCLALAPSQTLFRVLEAVRTGETGEAYVIDETGVIVSPSRFDAPPRLIAGVPEPAGLMRRQVRVPFDGEAEPSVGEAPPLTRVAERLLGQRDRSTGYLEDYLDYRGRRVVGAGQWLPELGLGVIVEEDYNEAFYAYAIAARAVMALTAAAIALLVALMLVQRALRRRVERSERQMRAFTDNSPNAIVLWNLKGHVIAANTQFERLLQVPLGTAVGKSARELLDVEWQELIESRFERVIQENEVITTIHAEEQGDKASQVTNFPVHWSAGGALLGVGSIIVDVSEQMRAQRALEQLNLDLETRVAERTDELLRARDAAEAAARSKAEFLANMSHEIRTPLNAVIGMSQLAQRGNHDPGLALQLRRIHDAGQHLLGIVNGILDFSSLESGSTVTESELFSLMRVVEHCIGLNCEQGAAKGLELAIHIEPGMPDNLIGDQLHLAQILTNLLSNAVKFTNHGEVLLRLSLAERSGDAIRLRIAVRDTGIGIPSHKLGELFQPFHQLDTSLARRHEGTGLGLVITRRLVLLMGGTIDVTSIENSGTEFSVELPFKLGAQSPVPALASDLGRHRVLVVDPHDEARATLAEPLRSLFGRVDEATRCDEAFAMLTEAFADADPYELVFVDSRVPDLDGRQVGHKLQQLAAGGSRPHCVLLVPTTADESVRNSLPGVDAVLTKPAFGSPLFDLIVRLFSPVAGDAPSVSPALLQGARPELMGRHVLLVEDNPINREVAKEMLALFGVSVATAADGMQALQTLNTDLFDIVLMDLHMPVMDGVEATAAIRRDPRFAALPVIALTADVMSENQGALRAAGVNAILNKPLDADRLLAELIRWLPPRSSKAIARAPAATSAHAENVRRAGDRASHDADDALLDDLRALPDLNVEAALARMLGRADIYLGFVRNVVAATAETDVKLRTAVAADDKEAIHDVVHGLKSLYASLGADDIATRCGAIERELMDGGYTAERIDGFVEAWKPLHEKLSHICTVSAAAAEDRQRRTR